MKDTIKLVVFHNSWKLPKIVWPQVIRTVLINFRYVFLKYQSEFSDLLGFRTEEKDAPGRIGVEVAIGKIISSNTTSGLKVVFP